MCLKCVQQILCPKTSTHAILLSDVMCQMIITFVFMPMFMCVRMYEALVTQLSVKWDGRNAKRIQVKVLDTAGVHSDTIRSEQRITCLLWSWTSLRTKGH